MGPTRLATLCLLHCLLLTALLPTRDAAAVTEVVDEAGLIRLYSEGGVEGTDGEGRLKYTGYVETFRNDVWGSVCALGSLETAVLCRQLFGGGWAKPDYSNSNAGKPVWMMDVECEGTEESLLDCTYQGKYDSLAEAEKNKCSNGYAYLTCIPDTEPVADGTFLIDGKVDPDTGVLEGPVLYRQYGIWGGVCLKPGFDGREAATACRTMGFNGSASADYTRSSPAAASWMDELECDGTEPSLSFCSWANSTQRSCDSAYAYVVCTPDVGGTPNTPIRLYGDNSCTKGRVQVYDNGFWGAVCQLDSLGAAVACKQLGVTGGTVKNDYSRGSGGAPVWMSEVKCTGTESSLAECKHSNATLGQCSSYAWVECVPPTKGWTTDDMCMSPGPCQEGPAECEKELGYCTFQPLPEGTECPSGACNGAGTCLPVSPDMPE